jgi:vacuolar protein sorting-associated protein 13A/C
MEFVNAINIKDERCESFSDSSSAAIMKQDVSREDVVDDQHSTTIDEPLLKGLLGKGKLRIIFNLTLHMAHAQILLMNEDETKLASLSQDNFLMDIKVCLIFSLTSQDSKICLSFPSYKLLIFHAY